MNVPENYLNEPEKYNGLNLFQKLTRRKKIKIRILERRRLNPNGITR